MLAMISAVSLSPASKAKESAFPNDHFGATYRIQLLSLHLANLSGPFGSRRRAQIQAVDLTFPGGLRTLSTREPFPGSRLQAVGLLGLKMGGLGHSHPGPAQPVPITPPVGWAFLRASKTFDDDSDSDSDCNAQDKSSAFSPVN